jgi:hypothetical protein
MTSKITRINVDISDKTGRDIYMTVSRIRDAPAFVSDILVLQGTYTTKNTQDLRNSSFTKISDVTYPFRARFTFNDGEIAEILLNEKALYDVRVNLN